MAELSVDGWQPSEDAVVTQSQRLVSSVLSDTVEQWRPGVGASSCRVCGLSLSVWSVSVTVCVCGRVIVVGLR